MEVESVRSRGCPLSKKPAKDWSPGLKVLMYIYTRTYVNNIHTYIHTYIHTSDATQCAYLYLYVYIYVCMYVCIYVIYAQCNSRPA